MADRRQHVGHYVNKVTKMYRVQDIITLYTDHEQTTGIS
jgi:hypothetical protein